MPNLMSNIGTKISHEFKKQRLVDEGLQSSKVDKVEGKGLSAEDYTTAEKTQLAQLVIDNGVTTTETYDDTALVERISLAETKIDTESASAKIYVDTESATTKIYVDTEIQAALDGLSLTPAIPFNYLEDIDGLISISGSDILNKQVIVNQELNQSNWVKYQVTNYVSTSAIEQLDQDSQIADLVAEDFSKEISGIVTGGVGSAGTKATGLTNDVYKILAWNTPDVMYWQYATNYVDVTLTEETNIYAWSGVWSSKPNAMLSIYDKDGIFLKNTNIGVVQGWGLMTTLPAGTYKIQGGNGLRIDSKWVAMPATAATDVGFVNTGIDDLIVVNGVTQKIETFVPLGGVDQAAKVIYKEELVDTNSLTFETSSRIDSIDVKVWTK